MSIGVKLTGHDKNLDGGFLAGDVWVAQTMEQDVGNPELIPLRERMSATSVTTQNSLLLI